MDEEGLYSSATANHSQKQTSFNDKTILSKNLRGMEANEKVGLLLFFYLFNYF